MYNVRCVVFCFFTCNKTMRALFIPHRVYISKRLHHSHNMHRPRYEPSVVPTPTSYNAAYTKLVPESLAREVFSVVKVVRNEMHVSEPLASDRQMVDIGEEMVKSLDISPLCEHIHSHCHENDAILFKIHFPGACMYYTYILSALLAYRARWMYSSLPVVCMIDPNMPAMPTNYSKAFVWRYQLRQSGSISGALLAMGAEGIKPMYKCITRGDAPEETPRTSSGYSTADE